MKDDQDRYRSIYMIFMFLFSVSCSLTIDVRSTSLGLEDLDTTMNSDMEDTGGILAGMTSSDMAIGGGMVAGSMVAGSMVAGEQMTIVVSDLDTVVTPPTISITPADQNFENDQSMLPPLAGVFGEIAGEMAGGMAGDMAGEMYIDTPIQALLPIYNCVRFDALNNVCLQSVPISKDQLCVDWSEHYQMNRPLPWSGDRSTCQVGSYHEEGYRDFADLLNLYRRHMGLNEVSVGNNATLRECALTHDIVNRDGNATFDEESDCYSALRAEAFDLPDRITFTGQWSLYTSLYNTFGQTRFSQDLGITLALRLKVLSPRLISLLVGSRGRASCWQTEEGLQPPVTPNVLSFPPPGENPFSIVKDGNYFGRVPWSISITDGLVTDPQIELFEHSNEGMRNALPINFDPTPINNSGISFAFLPQQAPQPGILYEIDLHWNSADGPHHQQLFLTFGLCGQTQPDQCQAAPDNCTLNGSHCSLYIEDNIPLGYGCMWDGPLNRGENCTGLGTPGCASGLCVSFNEQDSVCGVLCDPNAADPSLHSCASTCPDGYAPQDNYGLCP